MPLLLLYFRKLEEVHNDFMDKKDSVITKIYNESKERARYENQHTFEKVNILCKE